MDLWGVVAAVAVVGAVVALPLAAVVMLSGGGRRTGGRRGGRDRIRVGPGLPATLLLALVRRADTVALAAITGAVVVLVVLNARA